MKTALKLILAIASFSFATASLAQAELTTGAKSALDAVATGVDTGDIDSAGSEAFLNVLTALVKADPANAADIVAYAVQLTKSSDGEFDDSWLQALAAAANTGDSGLNLVIQKRITDEAGQPIDIDILINGRSLNAFFGLQTAANAPGPVVPPAVTSPPTPN